MKIYFIFDGTKHEGPFTIEELQAIGIKRDTFVWKEGLPDWVHAEKLEELEYMLPAAPPPPVIVQPPAYPQPEPVVEEVKAPVVAETPVIAAKEEKPVVKEPAQPEKIEVKETKEAQPATAKQKISLVEEKTAAASKPKTVAPKKVQPAGPAKKSNSGVWAFVILIVLGGGAAGYYFYKKNQDKKDVPISKTNLLIQDTSAAVGAGNSDNSVGNPNEEVVDTPANSNSNITPKKEVVVLKQDKNLKTDPKSDKNNDPTKTEIKPEVKKDVVKPTVEETKPVKEEVKTVNPVENLTITGSYKKNILGEGVLEGKVHNGNGDVQFKSVVFEARFISGTGEVIKTQQFTKTGTLAAGDILSFKYRTDPPKDTKTVSYKIVSAQ